MDILDKKELNNELKICYAVIQLQEKSIKEMSDKIIHLEKLLKHKAYTILKTKE